MRCKKPGYLAPRQASEQYFTCSQFLAQLLRQVMVRPHTVHSLLGKEALLPLKLLGVVPDFLSAMVGCSKGQFSRA
jgi:hypothetical protein